ncbi:MAG: Gfo/Idh/MocA family oxidoreductase [Chloroflexota bacterium]|nr:Gfo/Idh/MocA family oxidoreductase [Chloroflexota bacterium]
MIHPIRLGIIGTGLAARDLHWPALRELSDRFEIVALCNHHREKAESFAALIAGDTLEPAKPPRITTDYRELLSWPDVDAVDIALPIALNASVAIEALEADKHVFLEKPIAGDLASGRRVVAAAEQHPNRVLLVAENRRYDERFLTARRLLDEGSIGRPVMLHVDILAPTSPSSPYTATTWRITPQHLGGYLSDGGVHAAAALQMLGGRIDRVQGMIASFRPEEDPSDTLLANLHFESGAVGHLTYSVGVARSEPSVFRVYGTAGSLAVHNRGVMLTTDEGEREIDLSSAPNPYARELIDFYESISEGKEPAVSPLDALDDLAVIDAAFRSWREGTIVSTRF